MQKKNLLRKVLFLFGDIDTVRKETLRYNSLIKPVIFQRFNLSLVTHLTQDGLQWHRDKRMKKENGPREAERRRIWNS